MQNFPCLAKTPASPISVSFLVRVAYKWIASSNRLKGRGRRGSTLDSGRQVDLVVEADADEVEHVDEGSKITASAVVVVGLVVRHVVSLRRGSL